MSQYSAQFAYTPGLRKKRNPTVGQRSDWYKRYDEDSALPDDERAVKRVLGALERWMDGKISTKQCLLAAKRAADEGIAGAAVAKEQYRVNRRKGT